MDQQPQQTPHGNLPLQSMQPGEQVLFKVQRHPIGLIFTYITIGFIIIVLAIISFVVVPQVVGDSSRGGAVTLATAVFLLVSIVLAAFAFIANKVYWGNMWVLTSDSITQVAQTSLFDKQSSQLSLSNLEDVTAEQNGILTHMFNYGVLKCETAGERSKFSFIFCPDPNRYAQQILQAREKFEQEGRYQSEQRPVGSAQFPDSSRLTPQGTGSGVNINTNQ